MFSRNFHHGSKSRDGTPFTENSPYKYNNGAAEQESPANSFFTRAHDKRDSRASMKKSRPHSWHSTLQRGLARARSRSSGREKEKDRVKRASSALNAGKKRHCPSVSNSVLRLLKVFCVVLLVLLHKIKSTPNPKIWT